MTRIALLNGPNLNRLGARQPEIYGVRHWDDLVAECRDWAAANDVDLDVHQVDGEGELVALIHRCAAEADALVINPAGYTHTSVALRDALLCVEVPVVELHLSNPDAREDFRRRNLIADVVAASVRGFGARGYLLALDGAVSLALQSR